MTYAHREETLWQRLHLHYVYIGIMLKVNKLLRFILTTYYV